ncbi:DNA methyltransferase [Bacillus halotolerans]|uniref:DNA methyltransferase n=1 Tax=Bacillus halotolerans TaxID=260554 RepID=UPI002DBAE778|nr:DNA methyltransferase [Bacillus halotolerans]MEC1645122.1 DNA methyltransferase [Bacillus halotolerans]
MRVNIRSAKRGKNERQGIHNWHPYYAGYSENFVEDILDYMHVNEDSVVLDPWMGSGTTGLVCQRRGIKTLGVELNPVMVLFSQAKTKSLLEYDMQNIILDVINKAKIIDTVEIYDNEEVLEYISEEHLLSLNKIRYIIDKSFEELEFKARDIEIYKCISSFLYVGIFRCIREIGYFKKSKNPTWLIKDVKIDDKIDVFELFLQITSTMIQDLKLSYGDINSNQTSLPDIKIGDSRNLQFKDESVDYVITSPPYLTRIDYAMSTKPELLYLGYKRDTDFNLIRRATMGAPVITNKQIVFNESWGVTIKEFLEKVSNHPTKAARSYYLPLYLQYFKDAYDSLSEIKRVLKFGGQASLVVQSSYFKDVEARLGDMYVEIGNEIGLESSILVREKVKQHIAHVNTKSSKYVKNKIYYEDVVFFGKR